jgi:predicted DNA-binding transcriptional regulator AlpA
MNHDHDPKKPLTIAITGNLNVTRDDWEALMRQLLAANSRQETLPKPRSIKVPEKDGKLPRLAFSAKETAQILGISQNTVYRLLYRGLLKSSLAIRSKVIAKSEIERFLRDTSEGSRGLESPRLDWRLENR